MISHIIENHIVTFLALGEIFFGVIDYVVGAERADKIEIARAADAGHICAKGFCNLDCESAYAAGRAVDQNFLPCLNLSLLAQTPATQ